MNASEDVADDVIIKMAELLRDAARPAKIILFGSHARGDARDDSDIDVMVVEENVADRQAEMVRLLRVLSPLRIPVDLLVVGKDLFNYWSETPGNIYFHVAEEGKVLYEAA